MNKKEIDRHLDLPGEANRDKHVNFVAQERNEIDPATEKVKGALNPENSESPHQRAKRKENPSKRSKARQ